jgi:hypothetical protein
MSCTLFLTMFDTECFEASSTRFISSLPLYSGLLSSSCFVPFYLLASTIGQLSSAGLPISFTVTPLLHYHTPLTPFKYEYFIISSTILDHSPSLSAHRLRITLYFTSTKMYHQNIISSLFQFYSHFELKQLANGPSISDTSTQGT